MRDGAQARRASLIRVERGDGLERRSWRRNWEQVIPYFAFSAPIRRVIYTTNAIESLNSTVRRAVRTRGHFPNDRAAAKLIYLTLRKIERKWQRPQTYWFQARAYTRNF